MTTRKTDYLESALVNHVLRNSAYASPTTVYLALFSANPGEAGGGTELTGNGYARMAITFGAPSPAGVVANTNTLTFTAVGGAWLGIVAHAIFDAASAGNMLYYETGVSGPTLADGESYEFGSGDITATET